MDTSEEKKIKLITIYFDGFFA